MIQKALFIGGCGRSGTTLLGSLLGSHPECVTVPESQFKFRLLARPAAFDGNPEMVRRFLTRSWRLRSWGLSEEALQRVAGVEPETDVLTLVDAYAEERLSKEATVWVDHTPDNLAHGRRLARSFPECRFIHLVRDGRAVAASVLPLPWGPDTVGDAADWWVSRVAIGLAAELYFGSTSILRVRFGDLVREPEATLRSIHRFAGLTEMATPLDERDSFPLPEFTKAQHALVHEAPDTERIEAWKGVLTERQIELFELRAGVLMDYLGYERHSRGGVHPESNWEALAARATKLWRALARTRDRRWPRTGAPLSGRPAPE